MINRNKDRFLFSNVGTTLIAKTEKKEYTPSSRATVLPTLFIITETDESNVEKIETPKAPRPQKRKLFSSNALTIPEQNKVLTSDARPAPVENKKPQLPKRESIFGREGAKKMLDPMTDKPVVARRV